MGKDFFSFKKFEIHQDKCAMKVGTDGVLLGAWSEVLHARRVADIGTGTGLVAIMLAQRSEASEIRGFEIDAAAAGQAQSNMQSTPWSGRLYAECGDIKQIWQKYASYFDVIVSNPPFFRENVKCSHEKRNTARHTDDLSFEELVESVSGMLREGGYFNVIIPYEAATDFIGISISKGLYLSRRTNVYTKPHSVPKRVLMEFVKGNAGTVSACNDLILNENGQRTEEYSRLTSEYYLW